MNNPEKLATFGTQDTWRTREKLAVPTSYTVTNIDKAGKNLLGDRGKKKIYVEGKQSIVIWDRDIC